MRMSIASFIAIVATAGIAAAGCTVHWVEDKPPPQPAAQPATPAATPATAPAAQPSAKPALKLALRPGMFKHLKVNQKGEVELPGPVLFEPNSDKLLPESDAVLDMVVQYLKENPQVTLLRVEGHTDLDGADTANMELSKLRAMAVTLWIVSKGTDCKRLLPVGFGETKPLVNPETNEEDKAVNRRVAFVNAEIKGKPIAGFPVDGGGQRAGDPCQK